MSTDNGIYILKTPGILGPDFRVAERQAIENIWWENSEGNPEEVVFYFATANFFCTQQEARDFAFDLAAQCDILKYGISEIELPHSFEWYVERAKKAVESNG